MDNKADKSTLTEENSSRTTRRFDYLVSSGLISEKQLNSILLREISEGVEIENIFIKEMRLKREDIGKSLELYYGIPYRGYREGESLLDDVFSGLNKNYLIKNNWIPLRKEKDELTILIADPSDSNQQQICDLFNKNIGIYEKIEFRVGLRVDILDFINSVSSSSGDSSDDQGNAVDSEGPMKALIFELELEQKEKSAPNVKTSPATPKIEQPSETNSAIVRLVNKILVEAYQENASDIHIEPGRNEEPMSIRYRKDGACKVVQTIPFLYKHAILSRLKIMSR